MVKESKTIGFSYGPLYKSLKQQAKEQGYNLKDSDRFEAIRKAITMCNLHDVITESQHQMMLKKLHKQVVENLYK